MITRIITIRADLDHHDREAGLLSIAIPARELSPEECKVLDALFPNTKELVSRALDFEALHNVIQ